MNTNQKRGTLRTLVRGTYDIQKLRIQAGNRIVGNFKARLGQKPGKKEDGLSPEAKRILKDLREHYHKITDGVTTFPSLTDFDGDEVISDYTELCLVAQYEAMERERGGRTLQADQRGAQGLADLHRVSTGREGHRPSNGRRAD